MSARTAEQVMHRGVIATLPQTPLTEVAALMAREGVHCVVVDGLARGAGRQEKLVWSIISDLDLIKAAAAGGQDLSAGAVAASEVVTVEESDRIEDVVQLMAEHECTHVVVVSAQEGQPVGVVSSRDVACELARSREVALFG